MLATVIGGERVNVCNFSTQNTDADDEEYFICWCSVLFLFSLFFFFFYFYFVCSALPFILLHLHMQVFVGKFIQNKKKKNIPDTPEDSWISVCCRCAKATVAAATAECHWVLPLHAVSSLTAVALPPPMPGMRAEKTSNKAVLGCASFSDNVGRCVERERANGCM